MEPQVIVIEPSAAVSKKSRIVLCLIQASVFAAGMFVWRYLSRDSSGYAQGVSIIALLSVLQGIFYGAVVYFFPASMQNLFSPKRKLAARVGIIVEPDQISSAYQVAGSEAWVAVKVVRKEKIRSVFWIVNGIAASERGQIAARMWGFLAIPNSVPHYGELKALLEGWKSNRSEHVLKP